MTVRQVLFVCLVFLMMGLASEAAQPDRAAFDAAKAEALRKAQPTYQHNPVFVEIGDVGINLHAITGYAGDETSTVLMPGAIEIMMPVEEFRAIVRHYTRTGMWRPES